MKHFKEWEGFQGRLWKEEVNTRDFIQENYKPYDGDENFLAGPTEATNTLWESCRNFRKKNGRKAACWIWIRISYQV